MSVRRSKAMPTDGPTAKFLYTIIKQLDLKSVPPLLSISTTRLTTQIDWNLVASQLEISNGHAARMRFSRFKQQMEGTTSTPRASKPKKSTKAGSEKGSSKPGLETGPVVPPAPPVKQETGTETTYDPTQSPYIKTETEAYQKIPTLEEEPLSSQYPSLRPAQQYRPQHSYPQIQYQPYAYSYTSYTPYSPMTVAPTDLNMYASTSPLSSAMSLGYDLSAAPVWTPVKHEGENGGGSNEPVKTEGGKV